MTAPLRSKIVRPVAVLFSRAMRTSFAQRRLAPHVGRLQLWLYRRTGGRFQLSALLVPSLLLISTGAQTGLRRETPLMCWPESEGSFLVAGSNFGQPRHPAWTANVLADSRVEVVYRRQHLRVKAVLLLGEDREVVWPVLEAQWPRYREYEQVAGRELRIFRLVPEGV